MVAWVVVALVVVALGVVPLVVVGAFVDVAEAFDVVVPAVVVAAFAFRFFQALIRASRALSLKSLGSVV